MRILIVEDDPTQAETLAKLILRLGDMKSTCAESLSEALVCIRTQQFACVLLDLGLSDSESANTAASIPQFHPVPVVALTASDDRHLISEVRQHGATYLLKPTDPNLICQAVIMAALGRPTEETHEKEELENKAIALARLSPVIEEPKPWFQKWANVLAVSITLFSSALTGGAFLYRGIAEQAVEAQKTAAKFKSLDEYVLKSQITIERLAEGQRELQMKAQTSLEDRAGIHRELGALLQQERDGRADVVKRLERIEDHQLKMLQGRQ